jgi:hypothetical protein
MLLSFNSQRSRKLIQSYHIFAPDTMYEVSLCRDLQVQLEKVPVGFWTPSMIEQFIRVDY